MDGSGQKACKEVQHPDLFEESGSTDIRARRCIRCGKERLPVALRGTESESEVSGLIVHPVQRRRARQIPERAHESSELCGLQSNNLRPLQGIRPPALHEASERVGLLLWPHALPILTQTMTVAIVQARQDTHRSIGGGRARWWAPIDWLTNVGCCRQLWSTGVVGAKNAREYRALGCDGEIGVLERLAGGGAFVSVGRRCRRTIRNRTYKLTEEGGVLRCRFPCLLPVDRACIICRRFVVYESLHISRAYAPRLHPFRTMGCAGTAPAPFGRQQLCEYFFLCVASVFTSLLHLSFPVFDDNFNPPLRSMFVALMSSELTIRFVDI